MTTCKITYTLRHNGPQVMSAVSFRRGIDRSADQTRVTLVRRCVR